MGRPEADILGVCGGADAPPRKRRGLAGGAYTSFYNQKRHFTTGSVKLQLGKLSAPRSVNLQPGKSENALQEQDCVLFFSHDKVFPYTTSPGILDTRWL